MKFKLLFTTLAGLILTATLLSNVANAGLITGNLNVDNIHEVFLSTDDNIEGISISSGSDWQITDVISNNLIAGTDYFLHIKANNTDGPAAFLGDFSLVGNDHLFSNNLSEILTNVTDWKVSTSGWNNYVNATGYGNNGVGPWSGNTSGVDASATWIWASQVANNQDVYFSVAITATDVPEPSTLAIFALGMLGLASRRFKKQS